MHIKETPTYVYVIGTNREWTPSKTKNNNYSKNKINNIKYYYFSAGDKEDSDTLQLFNRKISFQKTEIDSSNDTLITGIKSLCGIDRFIQKYKYKCDLLLKKVSY